MRSGATCFDLSPIPQNLGDNGGSHLAVAEPRISWPAYTVQGYCTNNIGRQDHETTPKLPFSELETVEKLVKINVGAPACKKSNVILGSKNIISMSNIFKEYRTKKNLYYLTRRRLRFTPGVEICSTIYMSRN